MKKYKLYLLLSVTFFLLFTNKSWAITPPVIFNSPTTSSLNACPGQLFTIYAELALCNGCSGINTNNSSDYYEYALLSYPSLTVLSTSVGNSQGTYYLGRTETTPGTYKYVVKAYNTKDQTATTSISQVVTVNIENASISPSGNISFCYGTSINLNANSSGNPQYYYQWKLNGNNINGANSSTYTASSPGNYTVQVINNGTFNPSSIPNYQSCYSTSNPTILTQLSSPSSVIINSISDQICDGDSSLLTCSVEPVGYYNYQWKLNGNNIAGANTNSFYAKVGGTYSLTINSGTICSNASNQITINVLPVPPNTTITSSSTTTFCEGGNVLLNSTNVNHVNYQWMQDNNEIYGATNTSFSASSSGLYQIKCISNINGCISSSNIISVNEIIVPIPTFSYSNQSSCVNVDTTKSPDLITFSCLCDGGTQGVKVTVPPIYDSYSWPQAWNVSSNSAWYINSLHSGTYRTFNVTVSKSGCSKTANLRIGAPVYNAAPQPPNAPIATISYNGSLVRCVGDSVTLTGNTEMPEYSYQWNLNGEPITGANSSHYVAYDSGDYSLTLFAGLGQTPCAPYSNTSAVKTVIFNSLPIADVTTPSSLTLCQGSNLSIDASTSIGSGLMFQWQKDGLNISGETSSIINITQSGFYRVIASNNCSADTSTAFEIISLAVSPPDPTITSNGSTNICPGDSVILQVNEGSDLTYQWKNNGIAIQGTNSATYVASTNGEFSVEISNVISGCLSTSEPILVTVKPSPQIPSISSDGTTVCQGYAVVLATDYNSHYSMYQWQKNGNDILNAQDLYYYAESTGFYNLVVTDFNFCTSISESIYVNVISVPNTLTHIGGEQLDAGVPMYLSACEGDSIVLKVSSGVGLSYQWYIDGMEITNATDSMLTTYNSGTYEMYITDNVSGCIGYNYANLNFISTNLSITANGSASFCPGDSVLLTVSGVDNSSYQWLNNTNIIVGANDSSYATTSPGQYSVAVSRNGCTIESEKIDVIVLDNPISSVAYSGQTTFCQGENLILNANAGIGLTYQWFSNGSAILGETNSLFVANESGTYSVSTTNSYGCSTTSDGTLVTVNDLPTATITAVTSTNFCSGESVNLTANTNNGLTYQWLNNGNVIQGETNNNYIANSSGSYSVTIIKNNGCSSTSDPTLVTVNAIETTIFNQIEPICSGALMSPLPTTSTNGINGSWAPALDNTTTTSYTFTPTAGQCATSTVMTITVNALPTASITTVGPTSFCQGGSLALNVNTGAGLTYQWFNNDSAILGETNSLCTANNTGSYTVTVTNSDGCSMTSAATLVSVIATPSVTLNLFNQICDTSGLVQLSGGSPTGGIYSGQGVSSDEFNTGIGIGTYPITYTFTNNNNCSASATQNLTVIYCSGAGINENKNMSFILYPNPTFDVVYLECSEDLIGFSYLIFDVTGKEVTRGIINSINQAINVNMLARGPYFFSIDNSTNVPSLKLGKE